MTDTETPGPDRQLALLIEALGRQAEASRRTAELIESRALPLLERIALALERSPAPATSAGGRPPALDEFRRALEARDWDRAEATARELAREHPGDLEVAEELERGKKSAADELRDRVEAARLANDPDAVMASRDELARLLEGEPLKEFDRSTARWLIGLIQRRLRTGTIRPDVVELAARVADRFGGTTEGASLRAALPTLRRSAGLCPRCGEPYAGLADACPKCLAVAAPPEGPPADGPDDVPPDDPDAEEVGGEVDLNNERFWSSP